jgi:hypothetical protein
MTHDRMKEERTGQNPKPTEGNTVTVQGENQVPKPQMPHERDESAHDQAPQNASTQRMGQLAHDSVESGERDTDKGPVLDATYEKVRDGEEKKRRQ